MSFCELLPWVSFTLLQTQGDTATFFVDVQNHNFNSVTHVNNFRWVNVFVSPVHFRNVNQTFNAFFDFYEATVISQVGYTAGQTSAFWVTLSDSYPRIFAQLFQTQRYTGTLAVEFQNFNGDFVTYVHDFRWVFNTFPCHVSDVQQTVNTTQIYECTVVSQVLNDTLNFMAFLQRRQQAVTLRRIFSFNNSTTRNNNVVAFLIQLDHFELKLFAFQVSSVTHWTHVNQRTRQECTDTVQFYGETAFHFAIDQTNNGSLFFVCFFQLQPCFVTFSFLTRQQSLTETVFYRVQSYVNYVTQCNFQLAQCVFELFSRDCRF
eukprot:RCo039564